MSDVARRLFGASFSLVRGARAIGRALGAPVPEQLRVLLFHEVAPDEHRAFARQLEAVARSWSFITPAQFEDMASGRVPVEGRKVLLTFDDGFASNRRVAEEVLAALGITAIFFVVPGFVDVEDERSAHDFIRGRIDPRFGTRALPPHFRNMHWEDLATLLARGHTIGAHTDSHPRLAELGDAGPLQREISLSADRLAHRLGVPIEHFAFPFGDLVSLTPAALRVAAARFRFVHSGLRGNNAHGVSRLAIRRESCSPSDAVSLVLAYLDGAVDERYAASRRELDAWAQAIDGARG